MFNDKTPYVIYKNCLDPDFLCKVKDNLVVFFLMSPKGKRATFYVKWLITSTDTNTTAFLQERQFIWVLKRQLESGKKLK